MIKLNQPVGGVFNLTESSKATNKYQKEKKNFFRQTNWPEKHVPNQVLNNKGLLSKIPMSSGAGCVTAAQGS